MNSKLIILLLIFFTQYNFSQSSLENILGQISVNNMQIKAGIELIKTKRTEFNIGLAPYDPFVSYDYLFGSPKGIGNQTEFSLVFSFDFPTVYGKKSTLADLKSTQLNYDELSLKQGILLEAKLTLIELIYLNRKDEELNERYAIANRIHEYLKTKLERGDINIMEVNKAKLQVINFKSEIEINRSEVNRLNYRLTGLNGGKPIIYSDTTYPEIKGITDFTSIEAEIQAQDPVLKKLNLQYKITKQEINVNKDLRLPKIELGYRYQGLLNENYNGIHAGISIPLWEKNNTVKAKVLQSLYTKTLIEVHKNEYYYEVKQLYEQYISLSSTLTETKELFGTINNYELYERAFTLGEISSIEYLLETTYYYSIKDKVNLLEKELHVVIAKLLKHRLSY